MEGASGKKQKRFTVGRITFCGLLTAIMLILGFVESQLPAGPVPGIKLGLSNSVLVFAVYLMDIPTAFLLMAMKVLLSGFLFGSVSSMMYAFAGGLASMIAMALLSRVKGVHPAVTSMTGGAMHNIGQVTLAMAVLETTSLLYYMAILMFVGMACGALSGLCADRVMKILKSTKYGRELRGRDPS